MFTFFKLVLYNTTILLFLTAAAAREVVNFDFAWRYSSGVEPRNAQCTYEQGVNYGRGYIWQGVTASYQECCNECANRPTCKYVDGTNCFLNGILNQSSDFV